MRAMVERGIPEQQARGQLRRLAPDGNRFDLYRDFPLVFAQRGFATVGGVLANPAHYDGEACADPFEGVEYGRTTGKFFANAKEGKPVINSQAHGGMKYFLHADLGPAADRPEPPPEAPPFDAEYYGQFSPLDNDDGALIDPRPAVKPSQKREGKPAPRRGLLGGTLQAPEAVGRRAASRPATGKQPRAATPPQSTQNARAHAPAPLPTHPAQPTPAIDLPEFSQGINLHQAYTELHPSYTDRLNVYTQANGSLIETDAKGNARLVAESQAAENVAKLISGQFRYHAQAGVWHQFALNHWATVAEAEVYPHVSAILTNGTEGIGFKQTYLNGVATLIKKSDMLPLPPSQPGKIPFSNGLYDIATRTLERLTQDNAMTWAIPHAFTEGADCPKFRAWLGMALGDDPALVEFVRAFITACLTGRADLQKFLMLLGPGGTGKGTFLRLLTEILGPSNCTTTDLKNLEQNRFETAALYGKRLAAITDAGRYQSSVDTLKAVVGQDELRREEKHRQQGGTFRYEGMVLIASNEQLAATDYTSGLERRLLVVKFTRRFTPEEKAGFIKHQGEADLQAEIPAIIQWALGLSHEDVTRQFMRPPKAVADWSMESLTEQNPVVEWIRENLEPDPNAWTMIGTRGEKRDHGVVTFTDADSKLYPNYLTHCYQSKREALGLGRFRNTVIDMLETLKIPAKAKRHGNGMGIQGVKIRPQVL